VPLRRRSVRIPLKQTQIACGQIEVSKREEREHLLTLPPSVPSV